MIKNIIGSSYINVTGNAVADPYIAPIAGASMVGSVRYHNNNFEVYDGTAWQTISRVYPMIDLSEPTKKAVDWAQKRMKEEEEMLKMVDTHPAVKSAYDNFLQAQKHLQVTLILSRDE